MIGKLIKEIDVGKKKGLYKVLKGVPDIIDLELTSRLNRLRDDETFNSDGNNKNDDNNSSNNNNNNNNNNNLPPPPPPPIFSPNFGPPPFPPPFFPANFGPDQLPQPPPSPTNCFRPTTSSNRVFPSQPPPIINTRIDFSTNTTDIPESP